MRAVGAAVLYVLLGLIADWLVATCVLNYMPLSGQAGMHRVRRAVPVIERTLPANVPAPDVVFREAGFGQAYYQFYPGDGYGSPYIGHLFVIGFPGRSWAMLSFFRNDPSIPDLGMREGAQVKLPGFLRQVGGPRRGFLWIPLHPRPGVVLNAGVYGAIFALARRQFRRWRRARRIRRLRCERCAYLVAGLAACPECGTPTPISSAALGGSPG